jgi:hypothetical protein
MLLSVMSMHGNLNLQKIFFYKKEITFLVVISARASVSTQFVK